MIRRRGQVAGCALSEASYRIPGIGWLIELGGQGGED